MSGDADEGGPCTGSPLFHYVLKGHVVTLHGHLWECDGVAVYEVQNGTAAFIYANLTDAASVPAVETEKRGLQGPTPSALSAVASAVVESLNDDESLCRELPKRNPLTL